MYKIKLSPAEISILKTLVKDKISNTEQTLENITNDDDKYDAKFYLCQLKSISDSLDNVIRCQN